MTIAAIILAAGRSSRFERGQKLLADIGGVPLIRRVCTTVASTSVSDIVLVTAAAGQGIVVTAGDGRWRNVVNADAHAGLSSSLQTGLRNLNAATSGALIVLADMPGLSAALIDSVCATFISGGGTGIVYPEDHDGRQGHPVIWPRSLFPQLMELSGDTGGKTLLDAHRELCRPVRIDAPGAFIDIDTVADLQRFEAPKT